MNPLLKKRSASLYPPTGFVPARSVRLARFSEHLPMWLDKEPERTPNQKRGIAYERLVHEMMDNRYGDAYQSAPWLVYWEKETESPPRTCQPDGLLIDLARGQITIVEVKLYNSVMAWWQLLWKYSPVVRALLPGFQLRYVEIVQFDDPSIALPGEVFRVRNLEEVPVDGYGILTWKPQ